MTQVFKTDWLASLPVFYNEYTGKVSHNINEVIDFANLEFDPEGFNNYLDFGYSVFEQTPVKYVKFLRHDACLTVHDDGKLNVDYRKDPVEQWIGKTSNEDDVLHRLETTVRRWEKSVEGEIIIPTSGGYDSRLLNLLIEDKSRIRAFTYGLSENQAVSSEVVYAKKISEILGTNWEQIEIGDFHRFFNEWDRLFGVFTHAHGMYHIEFYSKILQRVSGGNPLLSGIIGDAWAGSIKMLDIDSSSQLTTLGYTHGLHADSQQSLLVDDGQFRDRYYLAMKEKLQQPEWNVVEAMRLKIVLLSYLQIVPESLGFKPWSPFLDESIALGMVTLPFERRKNRIWQCEHFKKCGLDIESMGLRQTAQNTLDLQGMRNVPVKPLNIRILREVIKPQYIEWINQHLPGRYEKWKHRALGKMLRIRKVGGVLRRFGLGLGDKSSIQQQAYNAYIVLLPIQKLLQRRSRL